MTEPRRQPGSASCFVCGTDNPHGLGAVFYDDGEKVWTELTPALHHQGWPGVLHGGIISAVLDETIGLTKLKLVRYYAMIGSLMMPHLTQRPVSLVRAPARANWTPFSKDLQATDELPNMLSWPKHNMRTG